MEYDIHIAPFGHTAAYDDPEYEMASPILRCNYFSHSVNTLGAFLFISGNWCPI